MLLRLLYDDLLAEAAYLIGCQRTGEAIVIDPTRDIDRVLDLASSHGLRITAIAETHIHADFLSGARELAEATGGKLYLSKAGGDDWQYGWLHTRTDGGTYSHVLLDDGDTFNVGGIAFQAVHTPGHTPEHLCYIVTDVGGGAEDPMGILSGDFVFVGDLGRPDLLESAAGVEGARVEGARALQQSALRFLDLPDHLQVWPAHGAGSACGKALGAVPQSTVGYERRHNSALKLAPDSDAFVQGILDGQGEPPLYFGRMKKLNRDGVPLLGTLPEPSQLNAADVVKLDTSETALLDMRPWDAYRAGHLAGSLHTRRGSWFLSVTGSWVDPDEPIVLICNPHEVESFTRGLIRIGLDKVCGWATPDTLAQAMEQASPTATDQINPDALDASLQSGATLLDVRSTAEHANVSIDGSTLVPHTRLLERLADVPAVDLLVMCAGGVRSAMACGMLERAGHRVTNVNGGMQAWLMHQRRMATSGR
ncbi:MAG: MBL fold metallo-hydrolase [Phycisphaerales bacterium]|nr:MBL fold metallo-hydrolase [Phycisphaerales bacterium]